jgi:hypothetical protein
MLIGDIHPESICRPSYGVFMDREYFCHYPASQHERSGIFSFTDAHVETKRWRDVRTYAKAYQPRTADIWHNHDSASPTNVDIAWLQKHTTVKR